MTIDVQRYLVRWNALDKCLEDMAAMDAPYYRAADIDSLLEELEELRALNDLQQKAHRRAVKRWQEANPDKRDVWPDLADMVVWLMERLAEAEAIVGKLPKTADGVVVQPDMDLWSIDSEGQPYWHKCGVVSYKTFGDYSKYYSTQAAAQSRDDAEGA